MKASTRDALRWGFVGAEIGFLLAMSAQFLAGLQHGPMGTTTLYQWSHSTALLVYAVLAIPVAMIGAAVGAVAEAVVHARRPAERPHPRV